MKLLVEVLFLAVGLCITNGASVDSAKPLGIGQYPSTYFLAILTKKITRSQAELKVCDFWFRCYEDTTLVFCFQKHALGQEPRQFAKENVPKMK